jgi:hypothetical protein
VRAFSATLLIMGGCLLLLAAIFGGQPRLHTPRGEVVLLGFNDNSARERTVDPADAAALARRAGAQVVRVTVDWRSLEPRPGEFDWDVYDRVGTALARQGIKPVWTLLFAPGWARDGTCTNAEADCIDPPTEAHDDAWRGLARAFAQRFPQSAAIEVWNEPNVPAFWGPGPDPARYAQLLSLAHAGVREVSPTIPVLFGGLANVVNSSEPGVAPGTFVDEVAAAGGRDQFDGISVHPYPYAEDFGPVDRMLTAVRAASGRIGRPNVPLWVTETGYSTAGDPGVAVRPDVQAKLLVSLTQHLVDQRGVHAVILYTLIDPLHADTYEQGFGIVRQNLDPKPALCAISKSWTGRDAC